MGIEGVQPQCQPQTSALQDHLGVAGRVPTQSMGSNGSLSEGIPEGSPSGSLGNNNVFIPPVALLTGTQSLSVNPVFLDSGGQGVHTRARMCTCRSKNSPLDLCNLLDISIRSLLELCISEESQQTLI